MADAIARQIVNAVHSPRVAPVSIQPMTRHASTTTSPGAGTRNGVPPARTSRRLNSHVARQQVHRAAAREVGEDGQLLERAGDRQPEDDHALHQDRHVRRLMNRVDARQP